MAASTLLPLYSGNIQQQQPQHRLPTSYCDPMRRDGPPSSSTSAPRSRVLSSCARRAASSGNTSSSAWSSQGPAVASSFAAAPHPLSLTEFHRTVAALAASRGGSVGDDAIRALLVHLSSDVVDQVTEVFQHKTSVSHFLTTVSDMARNRYRRYMGFELSLDEFRFLVIDKLSNAGDSAEAEIERAMRKLGPETQRLVMDAWCNRSSLMDFMRELSFVQRPSAGASFTPSELTTVMGNLIDAESRLSRDMVAPEMVQHFITHRMRGILVDWIIEVIERFKCTSETLHLAIALVDRYLMVQPLTRAELQLLGVASMLVASKYEEVYPPEIKDFVFIAASTYGSEDIVRMERQLFTQLEFRITVPTANALANGILYSQDPTPSRLQRFVVSFVLESLLVAFYYGQHPPSVVASAAVLYSRLWCGVSTPRECIPQDVALLVPIITAHLREMHQNPQSRLMAIRTKYSQPTHEWVGNLPIPEAIINFPQPTAASPIA